MSQGTDEVRSTALHHPWHFLAAWTTDLFHAARTFHKPSFCFRLKAASSAAQFSGKVKYSMYSWPATEATTVLNSWPSLRNNSAGVDALFWSLCFCFVRRLRTRFFSNSQMRASCSSGSLRFRSQVLLVLLALTLKCSNRQLRRRIGAPGHQVA